MKKLILLFFALVFVAGCNREGKKIVLQVGREKMNFETLEKRFADAPPTLQGFLNTDSGKKQFMDLIVRERTIVAAAKQAGYHRRKEYKDAVRTYKQEQIKQLQDLKIRFI